jgi:hypothetical protein
VVIGKAAFTIPAGKSETVEVKITNGQVKKALNQGKIVEVQVSGLGIKNSVVKLKQGKSGGRKRVGV